MLFPAQLPVFVGDAPYVLCLDVRLWVLKCILGADCLVKHVATLCQELVLSLTYLFDQH